MTVFPLLKQTRGRNHTTNLLFKTTQDATAQTIAGSWYFGEENPKRLSLKYTHRNIQSLSKSIGYKGSGEYIYVSDQTLAPLSDGFTLNGGTAPTTDGTNWVSSSQQQVLRSIGQAGGGLTLKFRGLLNTTNVSYHFVGINNNTKNEFYGVGTRWENAGYYTNILSGSGSFISTGVTAGQWIIGTVKITSTGDVEYYLNNNLITTLTGRVASTDSLSIIWNYYNGATDYVSKIVVIGDGVQQNSTTKSIVYTVRSPQTTTKGIEYIIQTTSQPTITKNQQYTILRNSVLYKSIAYAIKKANLTAKSLQYNISQDESIAYSVKYAIRSEKSLNKSLSFSLKRSHQVALGIFYEINTTHALTKGIAYTIVTRSTYTKSLAYAVASPTLATLTLSYTILKIAEQRQKEVGIAYAIKNPLILTRTLHYTTSSKSKTTSQIVYTLKKPQSITKQVKYAVKWQNERNRAVAYHVKHKEVSTLGLTYAISQPESVSKPLLYAVTVSETKIKSLAYYVNNRVQTNLGLAYNLVTRISLPLSYATSAPKNKTLGLEYRIRIYPYSDRKTPYALQVSPYASKKNPYSPKKDVYTDKNKPYRAF